MNKLLKRSFALAALAASFFLLSARRDTSHDYPIFRKFCQKAAKDESVFSHFRSDPTYNLIEDYFTYEEGKEFAAYIAANFPDLMGKIELLRQNDQIGGPKTYEYEQFGNISPTTLFYIKVAGELQRKFGDLKDFKIVEFGGGYGGLCRVISALYPIASYTIIDQEASLDLARKYLEMQKVENVRFSTFNQVKGKMSSDLVLSCYDFTETDRTYQSRILSKLMRKADRGYLIGNACPRHFGVKALSKEDLISALQDREIRPEVSVENPQMGNGNFLLVWEQ